MINLFLSRALSFIRCLWFMLEVLMTKNENNSHSFLRKMVENIKQTKDAQAPDDPKANEVSELQLFALEVFGCFLLNIHLKFVLKLF